MNSRYLGALIISPFIVFIFLGGYYLTGFCFILSIIGMSEFFNAIKKKNFRPLSLVCHLSALVYYTTIVLNKNSNYLGMFLVLLTLFLLCIPVFQTKYNFNDVALSLLAVIYVAVFFSFISLINFANGGNILVWLVFITSWSCDTTAYYAGRFFGRTKLCPMVSPKKTIEGSIGGILGSTVLTLLFGYLAQRSQYIMPLLNYAIIGFVCGIICQFGDLVASSIKRHVGVKDYSNLIPGHGGILDRFDSILYSSVVIYYYLTLIGII